MVNLELTRIEARSSISRGWRACKPDLLGVDLAVDDHPGSASQLCARRQVHCHRLAVGPEIFDNQRSSLQATIRLRLLWQVNTP